MRLENETIQQMLVRRLSTDFKGMQMRISNDTGVGQTTISRMKRGACASKIDAVEKVIDWMAKHDAEAAKGKALKTAA